MNKKLPFSLTLCSIVLLKLLCESCDASSNEGGVFYFIDFNFPLPLQPLPCHHGIEDSSQSSSSEEEDRQIDPWRRHKYHHRSRIIHLNICKCDEEGCVCCIDFLQYKICDNLRLVYPSSENESLAINFNISVNNATVFSDEFSLANLPTICYRAANIMVCGKLISKMIQYDNERRAELCSDLQLKFNTEVLAHINIFCIKLKKNFRLDGGYEEDNEEKRKPIGPN